VDEPVYLYYRNGCHLCEEMVAFLYQRWPDFTSSLQWRDVDERDDWKKCYGDKIPVLAFGEQIVCEYFVDEAAIQRCFGDRLDPL